ncbi:hypothetical protein H6A11_08755, partial [Bifidobacterium pullorum subsp. saeculare]|uniref:hypothetical protein n=1 Tax=Bifidobacterium pullorum TaxID=78448 RepID=UPI00195CA912
CLDNKGNINIDKVKDMLRLIDRPFFYSLFKSAMEDKMDTIGVYMKNLALNNNTDSWKNSVFKEEDQNINFNNYSNNIKFDVTQEMVLKWGT